MSIPKTIGLAFFDLETTGLRRNRDSIIQMACYCMPFNIRKNKCGPISGVFYTGVKPHIFPKEAGHRRKIITGAPKISEASQNLLSFLKMNLQSYNKSALVAHNGNSFDVPFLVSSMNRVGIDATEELKSIGLEYKLDTLELVRKQKEIQFPNHKLGTVYQTLTGNPLINAHNALADTEALLYILNEKPMAKLVSKCLKNI